MIAVTVFTVLAAGLVLFHLAATFGAPVGHLTQGGRVRGRLDAAGRVMALASAALMAAMILAVRSGAGLAPGWPRWTLYGTLAVLVLTTVANAATPSPAERRLWLPVALALLGCAALVALS